MKVGRIRKRRGIPWRYEERRLLPVEIVLGADARRFLRESGVFPGGGAAAGWPSDGSCLAVWRHAEAVLVDAPSEEVFGLHRRIRAVLFCGSVPPSDEALRAVRTHLGRPANDDELSMLLGCGARKSSGRHRELVGAARKGRDRASPGSFEALLAVLPEFLRRRLEAEMLRDRLTVLKDPSGNLCGRVLRIARGPARIAGALAVAKAVIEEKSYATRTADLDLIERFDAVTADVDQTDPRAVADAMDRYFAGDLLPDEAEATRLRICARLPGLVGRLTEYAGPSATGLLPAWDPSRADALASRARGVRRAKATGALRSKRLRNGGLARRFGTILEAAECRWVQAEGIHEGVRRARDEAARMRPCSVDVDFAVRGPTLGEDGLPTGANQTDHFRLVSECVITLEAARRLPENVEIWKYVQTFERYGFRKKRLHLIYVRSEAEGPQSEVREPWIVDICRLGLLDSGADLPNGLATERSKVADAVGMTRVPSGIEGIMAMPREELHYVRLLRRTLGADAPVVLPIDEILHGLALARLLLRLLVRGGARMAEARQLRQGCTTVETIGYADIFVAWLKPKNGDGQERFLLDARTIALMALVRDLAVQRFGLVETDGSGDPLLRSFPFGDHSRPDIGEGRYYFVNRHGVIRPHKLRFLLRVLLSGVVRMQAHDGRYILATILGMLGAGNEDIRIALHHEPGSTSTANYDCSGLVAMEAEAPEYRFAISPERPAARKATT